MNKIDNDTIDKIYYHLHNLRMKEICNEIKKHNLFDRKININKQNDIFKYFHGKVIIKCNKFIKCRIYNKNRKELWKSILQIKENIGNHCDIINIKRKYNNIKIIL